MTARKCLIICGADKLSYMKCNEGSFFETCYFFENSTCKVSQQAMFTGLKPLKLSPSHANFLTRDKV